MTDVLTDETEIERLLRQGVSVAEVARQLVEPHATVMAVLQRLRDEANGGRPDVRDQASAGPAARQQPPTTTAPPQARTIELLLDHAAQHPSKRIQAAGARTRAVVDKLLDMLADDERRNHAQREAAAQAARERQQQELARVEALADLRRAEAQLREARERAKAVGAKGSRGRPLTTGDTATKPKRTYSPETLEKMRANAARMRERKAAAKAAAAGGK